MIEHRHSDEFNNLSFSHRLLLYFALMPASGRRRVRKPPVVVLDRWQSPPLCRD